MYNSKIVQHYVEQEWTMTNSNLQVQGEKKQVNGNGELELDKDMAAEIPNLELEVAAQEEDQKATPFGEEAWDVHPCVVLSKCSKCSCYPYSLQDTGTCIEKAMDDLLTRVAKLHNATSKLRKPYNPQPTDTHERPVM